jgi:hypothetical protein
MAQLGFRVLLLSRQQSASSNKGEKKGERDRERKERNRT